MKTVLLPSGEPVAALGLGTWQMGENPADRSKEIATLRLALDLGATLIDTAERYGYGQAEELVGKALGGRRDKAFLVSKVMADHASYDDAIAACEASLRRLRTDRLDLYLLHWREDVPLQETMEAFMTLRRAGKIRYYGVSNFDVYDMQELWSVPGGRDVAALQVRYNLSHRGIERELLPWLRERCIPLMAYSPIEQGTLLGNPELADIARRAGMTPAQAALAWLLARDGVIAISKTSRAERLKENIGALTHRLTPGQLAELNRLFPPPTGLVEQLKCLARRTVAATRGPRRWWRSRAGPWRRVRG